MEQAADHSILKVSSLHKQFPVYGSFGKLGGAKAYVNAVSDVSLQLNEGETYGLVGESGSGKSTTGRTILGLTPASQGQVLYRDRELAAMTRRKCGISARMCSLFFKIRSLRSIRGNESAGCWRSP